MPRTKRAMNVSGWRLHSMLRDIATGGLSVTVIAERYEVTPQTVYDIRERYRDDIQRMLF
jgi:transposase-like protein